MPDSVWPGVSVPYAVLVGLLGAAFAAGCVAMALVAIWMNRSEHNDGRLAESLLEASRQPQYVRYQDENGIWQLRCLDKLPNTDVALNYAAGMAHAADLAEDLAGYGTYPDAATGLRALAVTLRHSRQKREP